ncbi:hypothetical protein R5W24_005930 [Gemmata sp. JC717]|uniref:type I-G CRISPR-associated protein, Cas3-extension family n=1 Tax=Gemmata algarum TaxID=2975278 RepID=UPI0021BA3DBA|nr:hypothetical protein [Gemmata algarum]MDY3556760.1 hypothetical protein [Gemmata algarum]
MLHLPAPPPATVAFADFLAAGLAKRVEDHSAAWVVRMLELGLPKGAARDFASIARHAVPPRPEDRHRLDWVTALSCESAIDADSQLQTVRCDYLLGNIRSVMHRTGAGHLHRALFAPWDYGDSLNNQSLHWEPSEDRRHAYQWLVPTNSRSRETGGMLGANRLALEAWPLFPSFPDGDRVRTRGFRGNRAASTFWLWPLWDSCLTADGVTSMLSLRGLQADPLGADSLRGFGVVSVFRSQRILVGKTPNLTPPDRVI